MQTLIHPIAHVRHCRYGTYLRGYAHRAYLGFDAPVPHAAYASFPEVQVQSLERGLKLIRDHVAGINIGVFLGEKGDSPVQRPGIQIKEIELLRNFLRKRTLARGGAAVHGYGDIRYFNHFLFPF